MKKDLTAQDRLSASAPVAVIDIGSNSVRLVVFEGAKRSPTPVFNEKVLCGLGRALATTGRMSKESVASALSTLRRYRKIVEQVGARCLEVVATAAAREAKNGDEFIAQAEEICGVGIRILSGRQEARLAANGVISGIPDADGLAADMGGGSLEITDINGGELRDGITLPLGGLKLIDLSDGDLETAASIVDEELGRVDWLANGRDRPFYTVGGTWRAFGRLHMAQTLYPLSVMHDYRMSTDDALKFAHLLDHLSPSSLDGIEHVSKPRRETLPFGALVLERFIRRVQPSELVISAFGLREGLLYELLSDEERRRDPLLAACEELATLRARSVANAWELCRWTDVLFERPGPKESAGERRLRHAACLLSDIGWRAHPEYRGEQSLDLIAHASFAGIDHPGRAFVALCVFYRNQGLIDGEIDLPLLELVDKRAMKRARIVAAAIRSAHMVSASMPGIIDDTPVTYDGKKLVLRLPKRFSDLNGERLQRRFAALADELDREPDIRAKGGPRLEVV